MTSHDEIAHVLRRIFMAANVAQVSPQQARSELSTIIALAKDVLNGIRKLPDVRATWEPLVFADGAAPVTILRFLVRKARGESALVIGPDALVRDFDSAVSQIFGDNETTL